jgi:DNA-binding LacI/PurR family transcriptional regulator
VRDVARHLAGELLDRPGPPTAIFASSDTQALGALEAVRTAGLRVPADVSVVGFDDVEASGYVGLTTVRQPLFESGSLAATLLLGLLDDGEVSSPLVHQLDLELVVRSTTAPPKKSARATGGAARMKTTVREDR